jgi:predicted outer membrane protein
VGRSETTSAALSLRSYQFRPTSPGKTAVAFAFSGGSLGDEEIAAVVRAIIDTQLCESRFATERARSSRVREIAVHAAHDFGKADETLTAIQSLEPFDVEDTPTSTSLRAASGTALEQLRSVSGEDFDGAYVTTAIVTRARLIEVLDQMASVAAPEPRRGLVELRSTLADALRDAQDAKAQLAQER